MYFMNKDLCYFLKSNSIISHYLSINKKQQAKLNNLYKHRNVNITRMVEDVCNYMCFEWRGVLKSKQDIFNLDFLS